MGKDWATKLQGELNGPQADFTEATFNKKGRLHQGPCDIIPPIQADSHLYIIWDRLSINPSHSFIYHLVPDPHPYLYAAHYR